MKQLHDLNGKIVLIDWIGEHPQTSWYNSLQEYTDACATHDRIIRKAIENNIPTLEQDRSTWLELSERYGGKLERHKHFDLCIDWCEVKVENRHEKRR